MGLGLLILVAIGKENIYLSAQPEITFFKISYKRYTNFSIEPTPQFFKTTPDFGRRCTVNISKNADLIGMTYICVELPNIQINNNKSFAWVNKIGIALINYVELEIGGTIIDRHYGDYLNIWNELLIGSGIKKSYNRMIGNIDPLIQYSQTKTNTILYIPLSFWFCQDYGLGIPLIALLHNDIKIHVEFNDINKCYNISPSNYITITDNICLYTKGEKIYQNNIVGEFIYFDVINQYLYYNPINGIFTIPIINNDINLIIIGEISNYKVNIKPNSVVVNDIGFFKFNLPSLISAHLLIDYIYLDNFERTHFIKNEHTYLITTVQTVADQTICSSNISYKLPFINPVKLIVWRCILISNINSNNQFNYTTTPFTEEEENLITSNLLVINSVNRCDLDDSNYYTTIQKYQNKFYNKQKGIYLYSFALNPKDLQPSGSMNFSRIDDAYLQLKLNKIINYQNPATIKAYAIQYNLLRINNGIGGLAFNI